MRHTHAPQMRGFEPDFEWPLHKDVDQDLTTQLLRATDWYVVIIKWGLRNAETIYVIRRSACIILYTQIPNLSIKTHDMCITAAIALFVLLHCSYKRMYLLACIIQAVHGFFTCKPLSRTVL